MLSHEDVIKKIDECIADLSKDSYGLVLEGVRDAHISNNVFDGGGLKIGLGKKPPTEKTEWQTMDSENINVKNNVIRDTKTGIHASNIRNLNVEDNLVVINRNKAIDLLTELKLDLKNKHEDKSKREKIIDGLYECSAHIPKILDLVRYLSGYFGS